MPSSKQIKNILKWILIICILFSIIMSISIIMNNHNESPNTDNNFNISHDEDEINLSDYGGDDDMNNSPIESNENLNENSNKNYQGVDDSPYTLAKNDPDWYYDHYDYGDYDEIDEYLESQGF